MSDPTFGAAAAMREALATTDRQIVALQQTSAALKAALAAVRAAALDEFAAPGYPCAGCPECEGP